MEEALILAHGEPMVILHRRIVVFNAGTPDAEYAAQLRHVTQFPRRRADMVAFIDYHL
jgi:hypothetical protein